MEITENRVLTITNGANYRANIIFPEYLVQFPLQKIKNIFRIMFQAAEENADTINQIGAMIPAIETAAARQNDTKLALKLHTVQGYYNQLSGASDAENNQLAVNAVRHIRRKNGKIMGNINQGEIGIFNDTGSMCAILSAPADLDYINKNYPATASPILKNLQNRFAFAELPQTTKNQWKTAIEYADTTGTIDVWNTDIHIDMLVDSKLIATALRVLPGKEFTTSYDAKARTLQLATSDIRVLICGKYNPTRRGI